MAINGLLSNYKNFINISPKWIYENIITMVGNTPIVKFKLREYPKVDFHIQLEGYNPTGSIKDRAAIALIADAIKNGRLKKGKEIIDASSGSMACSLAYFGRILGFPVTVVTGTKMTADKLEFAKYFRANVISHGNFTIEGNRYIRDVIVPSDPERYCFLDQLHNWINPKAHYFTTGPEILKVVGNISAIVGSLGSGGTMNGTVKYLKKYVPNIKAVAVTAASGTKIPGTGAFVDGDYETPFIQECKKLKFFDYTASVCLADAQHRTLQLRDFGIFSGLQTGAVFQGTLDAVEKLNLKGNIVMLSGDAGWKNMNVLGKLDNLPERTEVFA